MARFTIKALAVAALVCLVFDNASATADDDDDAGGESSSWTRAPPTTLMDRVSGVVDSVKQQATETLDGAGSAASILGRLQPSGTKAAGGGGAVGGGGGPRNTENRLIGDDALGRLQQTKGRAMAAARKVVDETMHKLTSTVEDIRRTVSGDDGDDEGGDRRVSNALDGLLRAVGTESRAAFDYASDVINETADRAKAAVERAQQQKKRRLQQ